MPVTDKGKATKKNILETACDLFISQGYHATSTRSIAKAAGIAAGAMYNHFQGKDEIFVEVLKSYHPWTYIPTAIRKAKGSTPEEFTQDAARTLSKKWQKKKGLVKLHLIEMIEFQGTHLPPIFQEIFSDANDELEKNIAQNPIEGRLSRTAFTKSILGLFFGLMMSGGFMGIDLPEEVAPNGFQYFSDIYLQGYITNTTNEKKGE